MFIIDSGVSKFFVFRFFVFRFSTFSGGSCRCDPLLPHCWLHTFTTRPQHAFFHSLPKPGCWSVTSECRIVVDQRFLQKIPPSVRAGPVVRAIIGNGHGCRPRTIADACELLGTLSEMSTRHPGYTIMQHLKRLEETGFTLYTVRGTVQSSDALRSSARRVPFTHLRES